MRDIMRDIEDALCDSCPMQKECEARGETSDSWIYEDQFLHCHEIEEQDYKDSEEWLEIAINEK